MEMKEEKSSQSCVISNHQIVVNDDAVPVSDEERSADGEEEELPAGNNSTTLPISRDEPDSTQKENISSCTMPEIAREQDVSSGEEDVESLNGGNAPQNYIEAQANANGHASQLNGEPEPDAVSDAGGSSPPLAQKAEEEENNQRLVVDEISIAEEIERVEQSSPSLLGIC